MASLDNGDSATRRQLLAAILAGTAAPGGTAAPSDVESSAGGDEQPDTDALPVPTQPGTPYVPLVNRPPSRPAYSPPRGPPPWAGSPNMLAAALAGGTPPSGGPPPGTHYAQLPGPPLLLAGDGGGAAAPAESPLAGIGRMLGMGGGQAPTPPPAAAAAPAGGTAQPIAGQTADMAGGDPYAQILQQHVAEANRHYNQAVAAAQAAAASGNPDAVSAAGNWLKQADAYRAEAQKWDQLYAETLKSPETVTPGQYVRRPGSSEYYQPVPEASFIKPIPEEEKTQAQKDAGGDWVVNTKTGEQSQVKGTEGAKYQHVVIGKDPLTGAETFGAFNPSTGEMAPIKPPEGTPSAPKIDESLTGFDYLKQFPPNVQAAVMDKINGRSMPTGGRGGVSMQQLNNIASRVGQDIGEPMDDASFGERKKILTDLGSSSPASLGGQNKAAATALQHADAAADVLLRLHSSPGLGSTYLARAVNYATALSGDPNRQSDITALKSQLIGLGQEMTKMFAGSPGAEAERLDPLNQFPMYGTPEEQQAYIATQVNRIMARVNENEYQTNKVLGPRLSSMNPALSPPVQEIVRTGLPDKLNELRKRGAAGGIYGGAPEPAPGIGPLPPTLGGAPGAPAAAPIQQGAAQPVPVKTPEQARSLPKGTPIILPDGRRGVVP